MKLIRKYGFFGVINILVSLVLTKFVSRNSRLFRFPIDIRNSKNIDFGSNLTTGFNCRIEAYPTNEYKNKKILKFGNNVQINDFVHITAVDKVEIMDDVLIASKVFISDSNHGQYAGDIHSSPFEKPTERPLVAKPIIIESNVWIGESVCVLQGVKIGKGAIIGAMSLVNKDIPEYSIAAGIPAKVIKKFNFKSNQWERV
jgi:lipopolysaccharide O-acetyltransferase